MKITKIEPQKHKKKRYSIFIDNEFFAGMDEQILFKFGLKEDMEIDAEELNNVLVSEERRKVKEKALRLISYQARSKTELIEKLKRKEYKIEYINEIIAELEKLGLINDLEFAKLWIEGHKNSYGNFKLKAGLFAKRIPEEIIDQAMSETNISEIDAAKYIAEKWKRVHSKLPKKEANQRLMGFLARRGINYETIQELLKLE